VVDESGLEPDGPSRGALSVRSEAGAAAAAATGGALRDDQVDGDDQAFAVDGCRRHPDSGLGQVGLGLEQFEPGVPHRRLELRLVAKQRRVESEITVGRVRSDAMSLSPVRRYTA
jgi:hypothetical protein